MSVLKRRAICNNGLISNQTPNFWRVMYESKETEAVKTNAVLTDESKRFAFIIDRLRNKHGWQPHNFPLYKGNFSR